jgi:hypothetical protein
MPTLNSAWPSCKYHELLAKLPPLIEHSAKLRHLRELLLVIDDEGRWGPAWPHANEMTAVVQKVQQAFIANGRQDVLVTRRPESMIL